MLACWPAITLPMNPKPEAKKRKTAATAQPTGVPSRPWSSRRAIATTMRAGLRGGTTLIRAGASVAGSGATDAGAVAGNGWRWATFDPFCFRALVRARRREDLLTLSD